MSNITSDSEAQQAWWDSLTDGQREAAENVIERNRAERDRYGRTLTAIEREAIEAGAWGVYGEPGGLFLRYTLDHDRQTYVVTNEDGTELFADPYEVEVQRFCTNLIEKGV